MTKSLYFFKNTIIIITVCYIKLMTGFGL